jgi:hypothetical protein
MLTKSMHARVMCLVGAFLVIGALSVGAVTAPAPPDERAVTTFLTELRRAVSADDRPAVASLVQFPLVVLAGDLRIPIANRAALLQSYDVVFSPALKQTIARAALPAAGRPAPAVPVTISETLVTIGSDLIRVETMDGALRIVRVREPLTPVAAGSKSVVREDREPQHLTLRIGRTQLSGALGPNARTAYVVTATKNQLIDARITGVTGRDIVVRVIDLKTHEPVDARAKDGVRTWTGRVPDDGDYEIDVVRLAPGEPRLSYLLTLSMR